MEIITLGIMGYITYQIRNCEHQKDKTILDLCAMTSGRRFKAEIQYAYDAWLLKIKGETEYHIVRGFCEANCSLSDTFSGDEAIVVGEDEGCYMMSEICKTMKADFKFEDQMYLCVAK